MSDPVYRMRAHERPDNIMPGDLVEVAPGFWVSVSEVETIHPDDDGVGFASTHGGRHVIPNDCRYRLLRPDDREIR